MPSFNKIKPSSSSRAVLVRPQLYCQKARKGTGDSEAKDNASLLKKFST